ncbi:DNA damage-induced apoptosis suppressor protein isoform X2 [Cavia porcellus]|uniref:DNA damage-induced apoptosis suppressor protein isoform X2 n=1 Tax=Cavia porcellus TaxID=10141 RepID=UPI002FE03DCF
MTRKFLLASVLALQNLSFTYPSCQKCFSRIILGSRRYIQDPNKIPEILHSDTIQDLLTKAVENCFVGQSFIFGVTNFEKQYGRGSDSNLQRCHDLGREIRALVACQIILPDPRLVGLTVIDYFHQLLQTSNLRKLHCGSQEPSSQLLSLDCSNSDLSSIHDSENTSYFLESPTRDNVSRFGHLLLELTSAVSQLTDNDDFSASEQNVAIDTLLQNRKCLSFAEITDSSDCHDSIQGSWSLLSYMDSKSTPEKMNEELCLQGNQLNIVHSSHHKTRITNSNLFPLKMQEPLQSSNIESFHNAVEIKNRYSSDELPCYQHHDVDSSSHQETFVYSPASLRREEVANMSQDFDPVVWDDLPLSESLDKFLAAAESEIVKTPRHGRDRKHDIDNDIDKFCADYTRLSLSPWRTTGTLHTPPAPLTPSHATDKAKSTKDNFFSNCEANQGSGIQESQPVSTVDAVYISSNGAAETMSASSNKRSVSEYSLPSTCLSALFLSSKDLEATVTPKKTIKILPHRDKISRMSSTSENDHSYLGIKYFSACGDKSLSEVNKRFITLCSKTYNDISDLCKLENKHCMWPKNQHDSFTICRKLTYPLETLCSSPGISTNILKKMSYGHVNNNLIQSSPSHESNYNASADLFDDIAKDTDITTEITKKSNDILLQWEASFTENHLEESGFSLKSHSENATQSSQKLSLQSISAFGYPKTCSPLPHFQSDLECDLEGSQDFVPCSQSTPVTGFHHTRTHGIYGIFKNSSVFYANLNANYNKTQISPENDKQQALPDCPQNIKMHSRKSRSPVISTPTQPETFNHCTIAECFETGIYELVPPTTTKVFRSDMLELQVTDLRKRLAARNSPDQKEVPRKKLKHIKQRTHTCFIKKLKNIFTGRGAKQKTPKYNCKSSGQISKESVFKLDCFSENHLPSVSETKNCWSPELFS